MASVASAPLPPRCADATDASGNLVVAEREEQLSLDMGVTLDVCRQG
jgi:hypothetical protein